VFSDTTPVSGGTNVLNGAPYQLVPKLAVGPNGSVAIAMAQIQPECPTCPGQQLNGLYLSQDGGTSWSALKVLDTNKSSKQAGNNLAVAIDPKNTSIVYVTGDGVDSGMFSLAGFRVQGQTATSLTFNGTPALNFSDANTVHADSRALVFDAAGRLLVTTDGGVYARNNPPGAGQWQGLNGNLSTIEPYTAVFDANRPASASSLPRLKADIRTHRSWCAPRHGGRSETSAPARRTAAARASARRPRTARPRAPRTCVPRHSPM
jgi:hypothetical protein